MGKTDLTKQLEKEIYYSIHKQGVYCCFEVTIGWYGKERVDMLSFDTKGIFRCFEIKSSVSDFYSSAKKTFLGHYNYFVLTQELYDKVKEDIPKDIGVYIGGSCIRKARKQKVDEKTECILKDSLIRSLSRYFDENIQTNTESILKKKNRELSNYKYQYKRYYQMYWDMKKKYEWKRTKNIKKKEID